MARRSNHYEQAFEQTLLRRGAPILPVDERTLGSAEGRGLKNFDYLLFRPGLKHWLIEVKGRQISKGSAPNAWVTGEDIAYLMGWQRIFGDEYQPVFAFLFDVTGNTALKPHFSWGAREYQAWLVELQDFQRLAHQRSKKWNTFSLSAAAFASIASPLLELALPQEQTA